MNVYVLPVILALVHQRAIKSRRIILKSTGGPDYMAEDRGPVMNLRFL